MLFDARLPQSNFRYLEHPIAPQHADLTAAICRVLSPLTPANTFLFSNLVEALVHRMRQLSAELSGPLRVTLQSPCPEEFLRATATVKARVNFVAIDPEDFANTDFSNCDLFVWSNPNRANGLYYPQDIYERMLSHVMTTSKATVIVEESLGLFSFNQVVPGSLRDLFKARAYNERLIFCGSLFPIYAPQGPDLAWLEEPGLSPRPSAPVDRDLLERAYPALLAFQNRQGRGVAEFQRRMLVVRQGLRDFADEIKESLLAGHLRVTHWPESGFYLLLDLSPFLKKHDMSTPEALAWLERHHQILLKNGALFGAPGSVQLCFAANPRFLRDLAKKLNSALVEGPFRV